MLTKDTIKENEENKKTDTIEAIYSDYSADKSESKEGKALKALNKDAYDSCIEERIIAKDKEGNILGYLYTVSGSNSYGNISLMVALSEEQGDVYVVQVEFLENTQSFGSTVNSWLKSKFVSKGTEVHEGGWYDKEDAKVSPMSYTTLESLDDDFVKCGATFGATLCRELITAACKFEKEVD